MADPFIIKSVTQTLLEILKSGLAPVLPGAEVVAAPPEEASGATEQKLFVYLYQALESPTLRNSGPAVTIPAPSGTPPVQGPATVRRDPVAVDLYYLLIPAAPATPEASFLDTYVILGALMRTLHDNATFRLGEWLPTVPPEQKDLDFRITFNPLSTSELFELWEAVNQPYRLSLSYVVRTVRIDSTLTTQDPLVSERRIHI